MIRVSPSKRAKPGLAMWAHQTRQTSGQALGAYPVETLENPACSSHLFFRVPVLTVLIMCFELQRIRGY